MTNPNGPNVEAWRTTLDSFGIPGMPEYTELATITIDLAKILDDDAMTPQQSIAALALLGLFEGFKLALGEPAAADDLAEFRLRRANRNHPSSALTTP